MECYTMIMEDTQVINWEVEEEEEVEERPSESSRSSSEPLGRLHIFSSSYGPEKDFPLYLGKNVVGRMPDCSVALPYSSISKQHAVIEILAWDKAPVLRDCGSLNGTQILRPPMVLGPGVSHRLRDRDLILFADLPCQYHRSDVPLPFVSRGPLTVEETPRVQGGTQPHKLLLAEDSEEEVDSLFERRVMKGPRTSSLATVVPESDEEGPSPALDGPGPPFAFNVNRETDEEESQQPGTGEAASAARRGTAAETEQPKPVTTEIQLEKDHCSVKVKNNDTKVERDARNGVVPVGVILERSQPAGKDSDTDVDDESGPLRRLAEVHLERTQPCGFIDSDTDMEEEGIPATPAAVPVKKRQIFHQVGTENPRAPGVAHRQESPAGSDTDVEEGEALLTVPLDRSRASVVINSNTDDEEQVSAALTLACLRESRAVTWNRDPGAEEDRAHSVALLERSQASAGGDSDTDVEGEGLPVEKKGTGPRDHMDKACSEKSQLPLRNSDIEVKEDKTSPGVHLERSQASATVDISTQVEEEVPPGPAVILLEKHQVPVAWTQQTDVEAGGPAKLPVVRLEEARPPPAGGCQPGVEENTSLAASAVADVRKSQLQAEEDAGTEWAAAVLKQDRALATGAQGGSPTAQVEQDLLPVSRENPADLVVDTGTPGEPTQPQREGAQTLTEGEREPHVDRTMDSGDNHDDSEDLDLPATQCFVERENQSLEVPSVEDESTQAFLFSLPQEPGPSHCSFQAAGSLDEPWEVLATQPFCPGESEASRTQPTATHLEAHESRPSPPRAAPQEQHPESPVHAEPLGIRGRGMRTVEEAMGILRETAERVTPERGPLQRETKKLPSEGEREDVMGEEELSTGIQDREQKQVLARDTQSQECDKKVKSASTEGNMESLKVEIETPKETQQREREKQTLTREIFVREAEKPVAERECEAGGLEAKVPKVILDRGPQAGETEAGGQDQKGQASGSTPEPEAGAGDLQGPTSDPVASGSQSGGERGAPVSPRKQQRDYLNGRIPPAEKASRGDQESPDAYVPPAVHEASAPLQNPRTSQSQKHPAPQSLLSPSPPPLELSIPRTRQNESQEAPETPFSSELDSLHPKPKVRPQGSSPVSSVPLEPHPTSPTDQPVSPGPTSWVTRSRTHRSCGVTPSSVVPRAPALQSSTSTDQPVNPKPILRATRGRTLRSSVKTPELNVPSAPESQPSASTDQPVAPELTSRAIRGRAQRSSVKTPEPVMPPTPEPQPSTSTDQPVTPKPTSRATRGRTHRSSVKTSKTVVPTAPELQPSAPTDQPVTPQLTSRATRGRAHRSSVKTPEPDVPTAPELQPSTPTDQPVTPKPTSRGRTRRTSAKTPEPIVPTAPELQPSASTDQPVTPQLTSRATRGRAHRSSVKAPEPNVPIAPELQPSTPTDQPVTPELTSKATRGRTRRSSVKTPEPNVPTAPELQPSDPTDQPVTPKPTSRAPRGRTRRSSAKISEPVVPTTSEPQPSTSKGQSLTPEPKSQATRGWTHRSSVKTSQPTEPTAPDLESSSPANQPVTPKVIAQGGQSRTLRSSAVSAVPVPATPEFQSPVPTGEPIPPEPIPEANCSRRPRASRKHGSLTANTHEPCSAPSEPNSRSSRNQRRGAVRTAESLTTIPEPALAQLPEAPARAPQIPKREAADRSGFSPEPQPKASQNRKRPLATADSAPIQKRLQREVPQKTAFLKEEEEYPAARPRKEEDVVNPGPGKRKREQTEEEPQEIPSRSLRRTKPVQESTAPKVLFTGVVDARGERAVLALGGSLASSVAEASHLVTDRIRRTVKFLCALGRGIPILSLDWLHQSRKAGCFLPPDEYVVTDPEQEKNFGFSLREALSRARVRRLLEGYEIHVTPGVQPPPPQMGEIISCCGGTILPSMPRSFKPQRIVITCSQDFPRCAIPFRVGLPVLSPEFLLTGVLKQEAKPEAFVLSNLEMSST
ncbi:mediator of DNA damage checkpoint protein 1 isoform X2 [Hippopotamus amphibius kiboko]|uniref:mediator of DNA damage checkpoint protein 1 isoform X2 n=1 Tax=Hippopotamus amphibius kiboko TaxID=575201 RepID=UPI00259A29D9|nr:mediator of DNA damage checkpoint protein 1 isoform X2 [Hippopotamus amphibius kiboko]XP_057555700.1 mediator of DNA damage checkpoint protein 1 isoform X2 [Hippopotamus amphibius kiboko]XP_057555701.1 mediator of DNA damage checkpoint protein 1 isoform X2 [Hippopotamus amphibius kiboko]XP_057555702.1 mediator of DNA damage checkpoint protein 1 isoform X2 [Hippopotamus amphibius kiboko]